MTILQSVALGALQGVAEFLPISSSGHLAVAQSLFGLEDVPLLYDVFLHLATLAAVVIFFWKKIASLLAVFGRWIFRRQPKNLIDENEAASRKTIVAIIIATAVTGVIGVATSKFIEDVPVKIVCAGFCVTGVILILSAMWEKRTMRMQTQLPSKSAPQAQADVQKQDVSQNAQGVSWKQALAIGVAQGVGTLPGISRSGSTIAGALFCGISRTKAADFSFIVSIPAVLGAFVLELRHINEVSNSVGAPLVALGCVTAFVTGYAALAFLMKLIKNGKWWLFSVYLIPIGLLGIILMR